MKKTILSIVIIAVLTASITDCGEEEEQPQNQSVSITGLFDNNSSATVKGYLTDTEWASVPNKIKNALNGAFDADNIGWYKNDFRTVFARSAGITIIIEKNLTYTNWKIIGDGVTLYLNFNVLDNIQSELTVAVGSMLDNGTTTANIIFKYDNAMFSSTLFLCSLPSVANCGSS